MDNDPYFEVTKLQNPNEFNYQEILQQVEIEFKKNQYLAVWVEPLLQKTMEKISFT